MSLPSLISAKLKELELTPTAAAQKFGIAYPSFTAVASGKSQPNSRTFAKYGKLLGISADKVEEMVVAAKGSGKASRGGRRRGRPPGRPRGRPPGGGRGRRAVSIDGIAKSLHATANAIAKVEAMLADDLAARVHALGTAQRRMVEAMLNGIG